MSRINYKDFVPVNEKAEFTCTEAFRRTGDIFDLANAFLNIDSMTHKKLQKLCYYAKVRKLIENKKRMYKN